MTAKMGRPPKPAEERCVRKSFSCPPALWEQVETWIPDRERSAVIQAAFTRAIARAKRQGVGEEEQGAESAE